MKQFLFAATFLVAFPTFAQKYQGESWSKVKETGSGKLVVVYYEQPGLIFKADDGKIKGVCVDILSDFQKFVQTKHNKYTKIQISSH